MVGEPGSGDPAADRGCRRSRGTARRDGSAPGLDPCVRRSVRQRAEGRRLPARRREQRRDGCRAGGVPGFGGTVIGAFYDALTFCGAAIETARAEGRLGLLPRLLATQAILAVRLPDWDVAIPAAEEARRLATELGQPIWLATAETAIAMIAAFRGDPAATERATARAEQNALPLGATHIGGARPVRARPVGAGARSP